jgi:hypothetical protein
MDKRKRKFRLGAPRRAPAIDAAALHSSVQAAAVNDQSAVALKAIKTHLIEISDLALLLMIKTRIEQFPAAPQDATREQLEAFATFIIEKSARLMSAVSMGAVLAESVLAIRDCAVSSLQPPPPVTGGQLHAAASR